MKAKHTQITRVINVDKNPALSSAFNQLQEERDFPEETILRQVKYLNNIVEQYHRFIKKITSSSLGFQSFRTASRTISGIEAMHIIKKNQIKEDDIKGLSRAQFIERLFGLSA